VNATIERLEDKLNDANALKDAIAQGSEEAVARILEGRGCAEWLNAPNWSFDAPALVYAAAEGARLSVIDALLRYGADINTRSQWWAGGFGVLHHTWDSPLGPALVERGATVDIHAAAGLGRMDILEEAIATDRASVNVRGPDGMVPLHFATDVAVADILIAADAALDLADLDHLGTPTQWLVRRRPRVAGYLLDRGAEIDPFVLACLGRSQLVRLVEDDPGLLAARSQAEAPGGHVHQYTIGKEMTLLHVAARFSHRDLVTGLLQAGAGADARAGAGETALHFAAHEGFLAIVEVLLRAGASTTVRDAHFGGTAKDWAENAEHIYIADRLDAG
jgi:ankyrin repeat protein